MVFMKQYYLEQTVEENGKQILYRFFLVPNSYQLKQSTPEEGYVEYKYEFNIEVYDVDEMCRCIKELKEENGLIDFYTGLLFITAAELSMFQEDPYEFCLTRNILP